jgi:hypothetical protein
VPGDTERDGQSRPGPDRVAVRMIELRDCSSLQSHGEFGGPVQA